MIYVQTRLHGLYVHNAGQSAKKSLRVVGSFLGYLTTPFQLHGLYDFEIYSAHE